MIATRWLPSDLRKPLTRQRRRLSSFRITCVAARVCFLPDPRSCTRAILIGPDGTAHALPLQPKRTRRHRDRLKKRQFKCDRRGEPRSKRIPSGLNCSFGRLRPVPKRRERLPPEVPEQLAQLDRAIMLLGHQAKAQLKEPQQDELAALLGRCPTPEVAAEWKGHLKRLRKEDKELFL